MESLIVICQWFSGLIFVGYGISCIFSDHMIQEFQRYGLAQYRTLTGSLELLGGLGLLISIYAERFTIYPAMGLTMLMALGVWTRLRVGDSFIATLPALVLFGINLLIFIAFL